jgi:Family of unknown function (DUF6266)
MKLIPITNAGSWKPDPEPVKNIRCDLRRKNMIETMKPLEPLLRDLSSSPDDNTLYDHVLEENIRRAFDRDEEDIFYRRLLVSKGKLPMTRHISVKSKSPGFLHFLWNDNSGRRGAHWTDDLFIALHHRASVRWIFELNAAIRGDCELTIDAYSLEGQMVDVYAGFVARDRLSVSTSAYLGVLQIMSMGLDVRA